MFYYCQCLDISMLYNRLSKESPIFGCILIPTLIHCGLMTPHGDKKLGQHEPDRKPLLETILTYNQYGFVVFILGQFPRGCSRYLYLLWVFKLLNQGNSHIIGTNELMIYLVQVWCRLTRPFATAVTSCMGRNDHHRHIFDRCHVQSTQIINNIQMFTYTAATVLGLQHVTST